MLITTKIKVPRFDGVLSPIKHKVLLCVDHLLTAMKHKVQYVDSHEVQNAVC